MAELKTDLKTKKYFVKTYGCQMNVADSEHVSGMLEALGFEEADSLKDQVDLLIVNTCSVRQASEDKVYGLAPKVTDLKERNPSNLTVIMGCMVGSAKGERKRFEEEMLEEKMPWADYLFETKEIANLPQVLHEQGFVDEWASTTLEDALPKRKDKKHAFVNISTGCDNFCTFCVVPYARGEEKSRNLEEIVHEVKHLAERGYEEVTLVGQNVNSWGINDRKQKLAIRTNSEEELPFADLLRAVHEVEGIEKISFISSNPFDFTMDLVRALKLPKISRYLHLAVQSGDNEILRRMNRRHTVEDFLELLKNIRKEVPGIEIGTDLIVGFPGETKSQFQNTVDLCKKAKFSVAYIAKYSPRKGTNAAKFFEDDVPLEEKKRRHKVLTKVVEENKPTK